MKKFLVLFLMMFSFNMTSTAQVQDYVGLSYSATTDTPFGFEAYALNQDQMGYGMGIRGNFTQNTYDLYFGINDNLFDQIYPTLEVGARMQFEKVSPFLSPSFKWEQGPFFFGAGYTFVFPTSSLSGSGLNFNVGFVLPQ